MKENFLKFQAQTTNNPISLEISNAEGSYVYDTNNKKYLDFVAGVSASNLGHKNKKIKEAILEQIEKYWHVMVYGEFIQEPTVKLCKLISDNLPNSLSSTYLTNSGTEAIEAAMKLAKRVTSRSKFIAAKNSYHGSTQGAMSIMGYEERKRAYRPLLPDIDFIKFNNENDISIIDNKTAAVILETIQGGAGFILPEKNYLKKIKNQCEKVGALLILDEIQPGIGRTGKLFAHQWSEIKPDVMAIAKGLGGGFPIGAVVATNDAAAGMTPGTHGSTFGGNFLATSVAKSVISQVIENNILDNVNNLGNKLIKEINLLSIQYPKFINGARGKGLMIGIICNMNNAELCTNLRNEGLLTVPAGNNTLRLLPPLNITEEHADICLEILKNTLKILEVN